MKKSYVQIDGVLYEKGSEPCSYTHSVIGEIEPYVSMIDGSVISSRKEHREHLRKHHCVEVGNDIPTRKPLPDVSPQKRFELVRSQIDAMTHKEFRAAVKRDADRVKWNSRED